MSVFDGDNVRVVLSYDQPNSSETLNVFWFRASGATATNTRVMDDFETWATTNWGVPWADFASSEVDLIRVSVDTINDNGTVKENIGSRDISVTGSVASGTSGSANGGYILAQTALPKQRGSKYVPGLSELDVSNNLIVGDALADLALLLVVLWSVYTGTESGLDFIPGILSRTLLNFVDFETSGYLTDVPAYQRRRKPNVGS